MGYGVLMVRGVRMDRQPMERFFEEFSRPINTESFIEMCKKHNVPFTDPGSLRPSGRIATLELPMSKIWVLRNQYMIPPLVRSLEKLGGLGFMMYYTESLAEGQPKDFWDIVLSWMDFWWEKIPTKKQVGWLAGRAKKDLGFR